MRCCARYNTSLFAEPVGDDPILHDLISWLGTRSRPPHYLEIGVVASVA
jgi:hypothetical protein